MPSLLCPLCNDMISGTNEYDLSMNFKNHFIKKHNLGMEQDNFVSNISRDEMKKIPGEAVSESVICPLCGNAVRGLTEDKLSYNLAYHMDVVHGLKVKFSGKA